MTSRIINTKLKFYTYPPIEYPFVLRNLRQKELKAKHEIVDSGVYELLKEPYCYSEKTLKKFLDVKTSGWKTVPDYPDIFKEHGIEMDIDNIERSKELMEKYYDPNDSSHLPVIQGNYNNPYSFIEFSKWFKKQYPIPNKLGIGTVCKQSKSDIMLKTLSFVRREFPYAHLHAFGLSIQFVEQAYFLIDSFDSTSFTFPRTPGLPSAKNKAMRIQYFKDYLSVFNKKIKRLERLRPIQEWL